MKGCFHVIIVHYNNASALRGTIEHLRGSFPPGTSISVLDNSDIAEEQKDARILCAQAQISHFNFGRNLGWGGAINRWMELTSQKSDFVFVAAHDARVDRVNLADLRCGFENDRVWSIGPTNQAGTECNYSNSRFFYFREAPSGSNGMMHRSVSVAHSTGVFFREKLLREIKFDEEFFIYGCESEIFLRSAAIGYITLQLPTFCVSNPATDMESEFVRRAFSINSLYCAYKHGGRIGFFQRLARLSASAILSGDIERLKCAFWGLSHVGKGFRTFRLSSK